MHGFEVANIVLDNVFTTATLENFEQKVFLLKSIFASSNCCFTDSLQCHLDLPDKILVKQLDWPDRSVQGFTRELLMKGKSTYG
jgi:hypothetical protein